MINTIYTKKLSQDTNYVRPKSTITESIQNKSDIEEQLKNYYHENKVFMYSPFWNPGFVLF